MFNGPVVRDSLNEIVMSTADFFMSAVPRTPPTNDKLAAARVIAHRGFHLGSHDENTMEAFTKAVGAGVDGIEFDIRWSSDDEPVIHHDLDCRRSFSDPLIIGQTSFRDLRRRCPKLPSLRELVSTFKSRCHLMIELKRGSETRVDWTRERFERLKFELATLAPVRDYHLMSLDIDLLLACEFVPRECLLPVAELNESRYSDIVLQEKMAGLTGHYLLLRSKLIREHKERGQLIGTGFVSSKSVLYRELNRGVDLIFTNHPQRNVEWLNETRHLVL